MNFTFAGTQILRSGGMMPPVKTRSEICKKKRKVSSMRFFDVLNLIGGLSLFLFGMHVMGTALEKRAGSSLKAILAKLTN